MNCNSYLYFIIFKQSLNIISKVDRHYVPGLMCVQQMEGDEKTFASLDLPFTTTSAGGNEVSLPSQYTRITYANRHEYVRLAFNYR